MAEYQDPLDALNRNLPLQEKLASTHRKIQAHMPFIARVAVAIYDPKTTALKTFIHSSGGDDPLSNYQTPLSNAPSLQTILERGKSRVVNNMVTFEQGQREHTRRIGRQGYAASYTMPMFVNGAFFGFVFFNAKQTDVFTEQVLQQIDVFGHLISLMVINEIGAMRTLLAAITTAAHLTHYRDTETGSHLDRMSRYSRLIAREVAAKNQLDDEFIERIFMFAPLHDIGKIGIPDSILLKPGGLTEEEKAIMRTHARKGREMIDDLLGNFGLEAIQHVDMLRNIAEFHHEQINGQGYPDKLAGTDIPIEARIVAVADVFDALTSHRPYKEAWTVDAAFSLLEFQAGATLDAECVRALLDNRDEVEKIRFQFKEIS